MYFEDKSSHFKLSQHLARGIHQPPSENFNSFGGQGKHLEIKQYLQNDYSFIPVKCTVSIKYCEELYHGQETPISRGR